MNTYDLTGQVALITGATGGIGSAIATELYGLGAKLVLTGRNENKLNDLSKKITSSFKKETDHRIHYIPADLAQEGIEQQLIKNTVKTFGHVDILVNNAAMMDPMLFIYKDKPGIYE